MERFCEKLFANFRLYFQNPRDQSAITSFAKQFSSNDVDWVVNAFDKCTTAAYTYMTFDTTQSTPNALRVRSHYLPGEDVFPRVWVRKDAGKTSRGRKRKRS